MNEQDWGLNTHKQNAKYHEQVSLRACQKLGITTDELRSLPADEGVLYIQSTETI